VNSPFIDSITIVKRGSVRRARIFYFRERTGKSARIREKKNFTSAAK
jgi:large subunit ribosomal protein L19